MKEILEKYYEEGLVTKQVHPTLPLSIWNYTPKVQYGLLYNQYALWDEVTTQARGLIVDENGNVVGRPFKKFFNIEEGRFTPTKDFEVYEKMDGSLGILFNYKGEWIFASKGSFASDQSIEFKKIFEEKYSTNLLDISCTYLFEILYPENRIVVDYGDLRDVILLGKIITSTGEELNVDSYRNNFNVVKKYDGITDYTFLKKIVADNHEGFIVKFSNGCRIKVKGEEYLRLHKIMTNISTTSVWEVLSNKEDMGDLLKDVPDEFYDKIKSYEKELKYSFFQIDEYCGKIHDGFRYGKYGDVDPEPSKKEFAEFIMRNVTKTKLHSVLFAMWDKKPYDYIIWRLIKPEFRKL